MEKSLSILFDNESLFLIKKKERRKETSLIVVNYKESIITKGSIVNGNRKGTTNLS